MKDKQHIILAIESSCDETAAAIMANDKVLAHIISSQLEHSQYGGVIPELASRLHQQHIVAVVSEALSKSGIGPKELDAIAFTRGPGLLGALLVGTCFAKSYAYALGLPMIAVNHMEAHVLANFLSDPKPQFPLLCLTVSGGHTQLVLIKDYLEMEIIGKTIDDAAGEAFDKAAKMLGLAYPGGPIVDKLAAKGNPEFMSFPTPDIEKLDFSFSGLKTSLLYQVRKELQQNPDFADKHIADICASYQYRIVSILLDKMEKAAKKYGVSELAIAGGVSANSELRRRFAEMCQKNGWNAYIPPFEYCTDNAAMIGIAAYHKYLASDFAEATVTPYTRA